MIKEKESEHRAGKSRSQRGDSCTCKHRKAGEKTQVLQVPRGTARNHNPINGRERDSKETETGTGLSVKNYRKEPGKMSLPILLQSMSSM